MAVLAPSVISINGNFDMARVSLPDRLTEGFAFPSDTMGGRTDGGGRRRHRRFAPQRGRHGQDAHRPRADLDRELICQGAANLVSGALGGLPVTGVIVRSSANVRAGAATRASTILHGVWIVLFVAAFSPHIERIPLAVLAGLLVHVGLRLVSVHHIKHLLRQKERPVCAATKFGVTFFGVPTGVALSYAILIYRVGHVRISVKPMNDHTHVLIDGTLTSPTVPKMLQSLTEVPTGAPVAIDLHVDSMDHAAYEALHDWEQVHARSGGEVKIVEHQEDWYDARRNSTPHLKKGRTDAPTVVEKAYAEVV